MSHVDEGLLHAYLDGALAPDSEERRQIEAHLAACADCRVLLEDARRIKEDAGDVLAAAVPAGADLPAWEDIRAEHARRNAGGGGAPARRRPFVPLAWAASLFLAVGAGWMARAMIAGGVELESPDVASSVAAPALEPQAEALQDAVRQGARDAAVGAGADEQRKRAAVGAVATEQGRAPAERTPVAAPPAGQSGRQELARTDSQTRPRRENEAAESRLAAKATIAEPPAVARNLADERQPREVDALAEGRAAAGLAADADDAASLWLPTDTAGLATRLGSPPVTVTGAAPDSIFVATVGDRVVARLVYTLNGERVELLQRLPQPAAAAASEALFRSRVTDPLIVRGLEVLLRGDSATVQEALARLR